MILNTAKLSTSLLSCATAIFDVDCCQFVPIWIFGLKMELMACADLVGGTTDKIFIFTDHIWYYQWYETLLNWLHHTPAHRWGLPVLHYHEIMVIYHYPFFEVITQLFSCIIFINDCIYILTVSPGYYLFMIVYVIQKIGGNENSPDSLNVMVNYHYPGKNRVITW